MTNVCAQCSDLLEWTIPSSEDDDDDTSMNDNDSRTVPDDVLLSCGDHFHWECLLDAYEVSKCPKCSADITATPPSSSAAPSHSNDEGPPPRILVDLTNEGGTQKGLDIYPLLREEAYLRAYPDERRARAFLELCREGDHRAIVALLKSCDDDSEDDADDDTDGARRDKDDTEMHTDDPQDSAASSPLSPARVLRYQDPLADRESGLHAAAAHGHREVAWLLLLLASDLPELEFPALVYQEAAAMGVMRATEGPRLADIRSLRDARGRTAEDVAHGEGGVVWNGWVGKGRLAMPG